MSEEVELPELSRAAKRSMQLGSYQIAYWGRTEQLRESLAQIAVLTKQVMELKLGDQASACECSGEEACAYLRRAEKAEAELATSKAETESYRRQFTEAIASESALKAELAALREGAREAFVSGQRVIVNHPRYHGKGIVQYDTGNQERMIGVLLGNGNTWEYEYDTVTRERILDSGEGDANAS